MHSIILFYHAEILIIQRNKHLLLQISCAWIRKVLMDIYWYHPGLHPDLGMTVL